MSERLLTTKEAAELLSLSPHALAMYRYKRTGPKYLKTPGLRGAVRYRKADLLAWLRQNEVTPGKGEAH